MFPNLQSKNWGSVYIPSDWSIKIQVSVFPKSTIFLLYHNPAPSQQQLFLIELSPIPLIYHEAYDTSKTTKLG